MQKEFICTIAPILVRAVTWLEWHILQWDIDKALIWKPGEYSWSLLLSWGPSPFVNEEKVLSSFSEGRLVTKHLFLRDNVLILGNLYKISYKQDWWLFFCILMASFSNSHDSKMLGFFFSRVLNLDIINTIYVNYLRAVCSEFELLDSSEV